MPTYEKNPGLMVDVAIREFIYMATGRELPDRDLQITDLSLPITEGLVRRLAIIGLSGVVWHARRGSLSASTYLVDRLLGSPDQPFESKVERMGLEETQGHLKDELVASGISAHIAEQMVQRLAR
jgi:hypothetical protein